MRLSILTGVGVFALLNAAYMWVATRHWYDAVPGVAQTGPLNIHFARDVGLAFIASGLALIWAGRKRDLTAAVCGVGWLAFHAIFHIAIWFHRGAPLDLVALTNLMGVQAPAALAVWAALGLRDMRVAR